MRTSLLNESANATIGSDGTATVYLGPNVYGHSWDVSLITVQCNSANTTQFYLYRNSILPSNLIGASWAGNQDSDTSASIPTLQYGEKLVGVWQGGTPNATATLVINGTLTDVR